MTKEMKELRACAEEIVIGQVEVDWHYGTIFKRHISRRGKLLWFGLKSDTSVFVMHWLTVISEEEKVEREFMIVGELTSFDFWEWEHIASFGGHVHVDHESTMIVRPVHLFRKLLRWNPEKGQ